MAEVRVRINENGRLVIPAALRQALGINPGDELMLRLEDDELRISTMQHNIEPGKLQQLPSAGDVSQCGI
jgi:AbrB family looped-hinge helix DNA binding protein